MDRRALRAVERNDLVDRAIRGDEPRLRAGLGLQLAPGVPHHPGHRAGRRGAGGRRLHQRARQGAGPRPFCAALRARLPDRLGRGEPGGAVGRAPSRLAIHVRPRRASGAARARAAPLVAGISALARGARPKRRGAGRVGTDRDRDAEGDRGTAAAGEACRDHLAETRIAERPVRPALPAPHLGGVGDLVLGLFRELRARDLAAYGLSHRVQAPARRVAALRTDYAGRGPARHPDLRVDNRPCRAAAVVCGVVRCRGARPRRARALSRAHRGAGADLHDHRLFLRQHHQYRGLSLHARALSHARAGARGRRVHRLAAVRLHDRADRGRDDACRRPAVGVRHLRDRGGDRRRDHRPVRGRNQGPRSGGGLAVAATIRRLPRPPPLCNVASKSAGRREIIIRRNFMRILKLLFASVAAAGLLGASAAQSAEPVKIRLSWVAPVTNWASIMLEKKDLAQHLGKSYTLEPVRFAGTPPMVTALANGELEVANLAYSTLAIAIQNAGMDDLRVIADEFRDGVEGYYSQEYMVLADGPIKKVDDLKGKVVMTNAAGSAVDVAMRAMLRKFGLEDKRDYTVVESPFPTMRAMLSEKKVDMIPAVIPFSYDPELRKIGRTLFVQRDAIGVTDMIVWTARKPFLDKNRAAMVDFMEDTLRITRWYLDPNNHKEAMEIAGRVTKQPPERFDWLFTKRDAYHDPDMMPDLAALQKNVDMTRDLGFVRSTLDVKKHADLSIVQEAAKRLK